MTNEELNTRLYEKMFEEQEQFRAELLSQEPQVILDSAYEYSVREDILLTLEYHDLSDDQVQILLQSDTPLADVFREFENHETNYMDMVLESIENHVKAVVEAEREAMKNTPVYPHSVSYAQEHGERDLYYASFQANVACKHAIERAISEHYRDNRLGSGGVNQVVEQFGMERTLFVVATTIQHKDSDGRISRDNREWAKTVPAGDDRSVYFVVDKAHPGLIDLFTTQVRRAARTQEQEKKPSVLKKLHDAAQNQPSVGKPKKTKDMEL